MPRGRRPGPGSADERAALRREKVRLNVQAFRRRKQQGLKKDEDTPSKPALRWVGDTKWQTAYDQLELQYQQDQEPEKDSKGGDKSGTSSAAWSTPSSSDPYETPDSEITSDQAVVSSQQLLRLMTPDNAKQEHLSMLSVFPRRFLPDRISLPSSPSTIDEIRTPCAVWVTTAYSIAQQENHGPLNDVLLAITTALASLELGREDLQIESWRLYQRSLQGTRRRLQPIIEDQKSLAGNTDSAIIFLACHAASVFEMYVNKSFPDMNRHVRGIGLLINHQRQFPGFPSYIGDSLLEEYRMLEITFTLQDRRLSAISGRRRKLPSNARLTSAGKPKLSPGRSIFTTLLDIADDIPRVMVHIDILKQSPSSAERDRQIDPLIRLLRVAQTQLEAWSRYLQLKCLSVQPPSVQDTIELLNNDFDVKNIRSYDYACCWMFCLSYENYALEELVQASILLSKPLASVHRLGSNPTSVSQGTYKLRDKLLNSAGKLAQLLGYFFQLEQGIIGRSLAIWPLEACWNILDNELARLQTEHLKITLSEEMNEEDVDGNVDGFETDRRERAIERYLRLCKTAAAKARSYGLPLMKDRDQ